MLWVNEFLESQQEGIEAPVTAETIEGPEGRDFYSLPELPGCYHGAIHAGKGSNSTTVVSVLESKIPFIEIISSIREIK